MAVEQVVDIYERLKETIELPPTLKDQQKDIITSLLKGRNVFTVLPTGFGKSLLYAVYPFMHEQLNGSTGCAVIVSPLLALMKNQVSIWRSRGIPAILMTGMDKMEAQDIQDCKQGNFKLLFMSPEVLADDSVWREFLITDCTWLDSVCLLAYDEAHVVSTWGREFRPHYLSAGDIQSLFPCSTVLTLTATCDTEMRDELTKLLHLRVAETDFVMEFPDRPNIFLSFETCRDVREVIDKCSPYIEELSSLRTSARKCIIFPGSILNIGTIYMEVLDKLGNTAYSDPEAPTARNRLIQCFHKQLSDEDKDYILTEFSKKDSIVRLVVASSAFGSGVDIPDINLIYCYDASKDPAGLWQAIGRGGRNGDPTDGRILYSNRTISLCEAGMQDMLKDMRDNCVCIRTAILSYFTMPGMDTNTITMLKNRESKHENQETCPLCICCSNCKDKCNSSSKQRDEQLQCSS